MSRIYLVRHGKPLSTWGDGDPDPGLDPTGRAQAVTAARALLDLAPSLRPSFVVSSPLRRCQETAAPFAQALGVAVRIDPRVGEIPTPAALDEAERPGWLRQAFQGRWDEVTGELDYAAWSAQVAAAVAEHRGGAVFSHFVAINAAAGVADGDDRVMIFRPDHASITVFEAGSGGLRLIERGREAATQVL